MKRRSGAWWVVLSLIAATGCASDGSAGEWDQPRYSSSGDMLIGVNATFDLGYRPRWAADLKLSSRDQVVSTAILDDLVVAVVRPGNLVAAISMRNGRVLWVRSFGTPLERLFAAFRWQDSLYVNSGTRVFEIDPYSGELKGSAPLAQIVGGGPVLIEDKAIFGSVDGTVFAHSLITGRSRWKYQLPTQIRAPLVPVGLNVLATDNAGNYVLLNAQGQPLWQGYVFDAVVAPSAVDRTSVYIPSVDTFLYALNRSTGEDKWKYPAALPLREAPKAIGLGVYVPVGETLVALDAVDGTSPRWTVREKARPVTALGDNLLAVTDRGLILVEVDTGRVVRRLPTRTLQEILLGPDDSLILVSPAGRLMRLDPL